MTTITELNNCLKRINDSRVKPDTGRLYLFIDLFGRVATTAEKAFAAPMKAVIETIQKLSRKIASDNSQTTLEARKLKRNFKTLINQYRNTGYFRSLYFNSVQNQILSDLKVNAHVQFTKETRDPEWRDLKQRKNIYKPFPADSKPRRPDFNGRAVISVDKTIGYHLGGATGAPNFDVLNNETEIPLDRFLMTFEKQLRKVRHYKDAISHVSFLTRKILNEQLDTGIPISAEDFLKKLEKAIKENNTQILTFDREEFKTVMGKNVKDGVGYDVPNNINLFSPAVRLLIDDYNSDKWTQNEKRTLTYTVLDENWMSDTLRELVRLEGFESTLQNLAGFPPKKGMLNRVYEASMGILQMALNGLSQITFGK